MAEERGTADGEKKRKRKRLKKLCADIREQVLTESGVKPTLHYK